MAKSKTLALTAVVVIDRPDRPAEAWLGPVLEATGQVLWADGVGTALQHVRKSGAELVLLAGPTPPARAVAFVESMRQVHRSAAVVVAVKKVSVDLAVRLVRAGAYDVIEAPTGPDRLERLIAEIAARRQEDADRDGQFVSGHCPPGVEIVGHSEAIVSSLETIRLVARSGCDPVLLLGETGTGKELAARAVHAWRCGQAESFVAVNCAALTANLLESELFGHVKGAFTGASGEKIGLLELAGTGTIFLDEISEMPPDLQAKLLRVLQERRFRKVGGIEDVACLATVIASSNRDLLAEAALGRFRKDLYYRLAVFPITLTPLSHPRRCSDIPLLAEYFLATSRLSVGRKSDPLSDDVCRRLIEHDWPGNVRELRNVMERAMILSAGGRITVRHLIFDQSGSPQPTASDRLADPDAQAATAASDTSAFSLETAEREFIVRALKETGWQRTKAAALLGITRATLHAKLKRYDIQVPASERRSSSARSASPDSGVRS